MCPRLDGLDKKFYKNFLGAKALLEENMKDWLKNGIPNRACDRYIKLIPKELIKTNNLAETRGIALLNTDYKINAGIVNSNLAQSFKSLTNEDQTGFVPGRFIIDNVHSILKFKNSLKGEEMILLVDMEKVFDKVSHDFLKQTIINMNLEDSQVSRAVNSMYNNVKSLVIYETSSPLIFHSGVRQGCPFLPTHFALVIEPLLNHLRARLEGLEILNIKKKVNALMT